MTATDGKPVTQGRVASINLLVSSRGPRPAPGVAVGPWPWVALAALSWSVTALALAILLGWWHPSLQFGGG